MRFHSDPLEDGWHADAAVVSVGAPRRFVFRGAGDAAAKAAQRYAFTVRSGDVVRMGAHCQERFQHALLPERGGADVGPRASLVFKRRADASAPVDDGA